jgi:hypothetical protein
LRQPSLVIRPLVILDSGRLFGNFSFPSTHLECIEPVLEAFLAIRDFELRSAHGGMYEKEAGGPHIDDSAYTRALPISILV